MNSKNVSSRIDFWKNYFEQKNRLYKKLNPNNKVIVLPKKEVFNFFR